MLNVDKDSPCSYRPIFNSYEVSKLHERLFLHRIQIHVISSPTVTSRPVEKSFSWNCTSCYSWFDMYSLQSLIKSRLCCTWCQCSLCHDWSSAPHCQTWNRVRCRWYSSKMAHVLPDWVLYLFSLVIYLLKLGSSTMACHKGLYWVPSWSLAAISSEHGLLHQSMLTTLSCLFACPCYLCYQLLEAWKLPTLHCTARVVLL